MVPEPVSSKIPRKKFYEILLCLHSLQFFQKLHLHQIYRKSKRES